MRTREVGLSRRLRRRTGICPEGTSVRRHWPLWPGKVSRRSRDPFPRRAGWPLLASPEVELCEMRGCLPGRG